MPPPAPACPAARTHVLRSKTISNQSPHPGPQDKYHLDKLQHFHTGLHFQHVLESPGLVTLCILTVGGELSVRTEVCARRQTYQGQGSARLSAAPADPIASKRSEAVLRSPNCFLALKAGLLILSHPSAHRVCRSLRAASHDTACFMRCWQSWHTPHAAWSQFGSLFSRRHCSCRHAGAPLRARVHSACLPRPQASAHTASHMHRAQR